MSVSRSSQIEISAEEGCRDVVDIKLLFYDRINLEGFISVISRCLLIIQPLSRHIYAHLRLLILAIINIFTYYMLIRAKRRGHMPRPAKPRFVSAYPVMAAFVPRGITVTGEVLISVEEFEAIRLSDFEHLDQEKAAAMMGVSRHTFGRLLGKARAAVAEALVLGKELRIEGGNYEIRGRGRQRRRRGGGGGGRGRRQTVLLDNQPGEVLKGQEEMEQNLKGREQEPAEDLASAELLKEVRPNVGKAVEQAAKEKK